MVAGLPEALLGREGGALAVLAHVERAWACSCRIGQNPQVQGFRDVITRIVLGQRLGQATDQFNIRWAALSTELTELLHKMQFGFLVDDGDLANRWVSRDDARNYV